MNLFIMLPKLSILVLLLSLVACRSSLKELSYDPPGAIDTKDKPITLQEKKIFRFGGTYFSNDFDGARLNGVDSMGPSLYRLSILPENQPINSSPWFALKAWSEDSVSVELILTYPGHRHRYWPKLAQKDRTWRPVESEKISFESGNAHMQVSLGPDTLWIAGQELHPTDSVYRWTKRLEGMGMNIDTLGLSRGGRWLPTLTAGKTEAKDWVFMMGRQHPPEITGYLAMKAFVETVMADTGLGPRFRESFGIAFVPMLNPDGIDLGHWRHGMGGVDLNRDWASFNQVETQLVRDYLIELKKKRKRIAFGLDFHSTNRDLFYVYDPKMKTHRRGFTHLWLNRMQELLPNYRPKSSPVSMDSPSAKYFFFHQLKAEFVTYEVGDETDRMLIAERAQTAAYAMMELLLLE